MEFIKYEIKKGDTLESIALKYKLDVRELISFHNQHCGITNTIIDNYLPIHLQYLFLNHNSIHEKNLLKINNKVVDTNIKYRINMYQKLIANDKIFADTDTEIIWNLKFLEIAESKIIIEIKIISYEVKNQPADTSKLINFSMLFNYPVENLKLELNHYGKIERILNQKEVFEKWQTLRNKDLAQYQYEESMKGIFIAGDNEFSDTIKSLQNNLLYVLFFDKVYNTPFLSEPYIGDSINLYSKLFQGTKIPFTNTQEFYNNENIKVKNRYSFIVNTETRELEKKYLANYKSLIGEDFNYDYYIESDAGYHIENGILQYLDAVCIEKSNEKLFHHTQYKIQLLN